MNEVGQLQAALETDQASKGNLGLGSFKPLLMKEGLSLSLEGESKSASFLRSHSIPKRQQSLKNVSFQG